MDSNLLTIDQVITLATSPQIDKVQRTSQVRCTSMQQKHVFGTVIA
jgi:hypothetical protein